MNIILASASPRRREILELIGLAPDAILPSEADETVEASLPPEEKVMTLAARKAASVAARDDLPPDALIIASDTVVVYGGTVLGKPRDRADGCRMLKMLSGRTHAVYTGVCLLYQNKKQIFYNKTDVEFYPLTDGEINAYLDTGEPFDKAGAYGIQGKGSVLVRRIDGDFFSVMGLPAAQVRRAVREIAEK
ncbi:MAG: septum formation inhibitor Maf [Clostridia bacterium]|nr:septum formation inhibitor Maf [Clostridia bacterium]